MWSLPLLALLILTIIVHATAHPSSTVFNRTLPYPHPARSPRATPALMQELLGPDGGKRTIKAWNGLYLAVSSRLSAGLFRTLSIIDVAEWSRSQGQYWYIEQINDHEVALKSLTGKYITHWWFGEATGADEAKEWEMLTPVKNEDDSWSFHSRWGYYLSAHLTTNEVNFMPHNDRCEHWKLESW